MIKWSNDNENNNHYVSILFMLQLLHAETLNTIALTRQQMSVQERPQVC